MGYDTLACESFGFGPERRLHLFKRDSRAIAGPTLNCKHLDKAAPTLTPDVEYSRELESPTKEGSCSGNERTTCSSSSEARTRESSRGSSPLPSSPSRIPDIPELPVEPQELPMRNGFIHFDNTPVDQRVIRSMPHKMFSQCVLEESSSPVCNQNAAATATGHVTSPAPTLSTPHNGGCWLAAGAEVYIDGLTKSPQFNGLVGMVESFDEVSCRYSVSINSPSAVGGRQTAKVRSENLRCIIRAMPCIMLPCSPTSRSAASMSPLSTSPPSTRW